MLRAIAVLAVLADHLFPSIPRAVGHFGVLVFFVHTALALMMSLDRMAHESRWPLRFYVRRAFRIYPLSVLCVTAVVALRIPYSANGEAFQAPTVQRVMANLLLVQNFLPGTQSVNAPLWSLPFEIQIYVLLPLLWWIVRHYGPRVVKPMIAAAIVIATAEALCVTRTTWITEYFPCFMGGILAVFENGPGTEAAVLDVARLYRTVGRGVLRRGPDCRVAGVFGAGLPGPYIPRVPIGRCLFGC